MDFVSYLVLKDVYDDAEISLQSSGACAPLMIITLVISHTLAFFFKMKLVEFSQIMMKCELSLNQSVGLCSPLHLVMSYMSTSAVFPEIDPLSLVLFDFEFSLTS